MDMEGNKGVGMQWEQQGFDQQWLINVLRENMQPSRAKPGIPASHSIKQSKMEQTHKFNHYQSKSIFGFLEKEFKN